MANLLVIDWGRRHLRIAEIEPRAEVATATHLATADRGEGSGTLAELLREEGLQRKRYARVVVAVGGDLVQFRRLKLPPGPTEELPSMVSLLAEREFGASEEGALLDFFPLRGDSVNPYEVLVARLPAAENAAIRAAATAAGLTIDRLTLRPAAAATAVTAMDPALRRGAYVLVLPAGDGVDFVLLEDGLPSMIRRATAGEEGAVSRGELRRTLSAAAIQLGDRPLDAALFCSCEPDLPLEDQAIPARTLDFKRWIASKSAPDLGVESAYLGAVAAGLAESLGVPPTIDFLNPRGSQVERPSRRPIYLAAGATAAIVLGGAWWGYAHLNRFEGETQQLRVELRGLNEQIERFAPIRKRSESVGRWLATDVTWLDELERLSRTLRPLPLDSKEFAASHDVQVTGVTAIAKAGLTESGGTITLEGYARNPDDLNEIERDLRDAKHQVEPGAVAVVQGNGEYGWSFRSVVTAAPATDPSEEGSP